MKKILMTLIGILSFVLFSSSQADTVTITSSGKSISFPQAAVRAFKTGEGRMARKEFRLTQHQLDAIHKTMGQPSVPLHKPIPNDAAHNAPITVTIESKKEVKTGMLSAPEVYNNCQLIARRDERVIDCPTN